ncbi:unnamed protein product [Allacma fusca]|uniref:BPTI/Kunitz inhibitor domain-containing protein n=1 Tax=Allacma fusca TaxID=39272 RepID=A0A8J2L8B3_9HEXA|nr:unnamed protein product [Allacma fusca]
MEDYDGSFPNDNLHSRYGPLHIEKPPISPLKNEWFAAGKEIGLEVKDPNGFQSQSVFPIDYTTKRGTKFSAHRAYLDPVMERPNLRVITYAHVEKVICDDQNRAVATLLGPFIVDKGKSLMGGRDFDSAALQNYLKSGSGPFGFNDPKYLSHPDDIKILVEGIKKSFEMASGFRNVWAPSNRCISNATSHNHQYQLPDNHDRGERAFLGQLLNENILSNRPDSTGNTETTRTTVIREGFIMFRIIIICGTEFCGFSGLVNPKREHEETITLTPIIVSLETRIEGAEQFLGACKSFSYGGFQGNANNFKTREDCVRSSALRDRNLL